jgi:hypothetical protein
MTTCRDSFSHSLTQGCFIRKKINVGLRTAEQGRSPVAMKQCSNSSVCSIHETGSPTCGHPVFLVSRYDTSICLLYYYHTKTLVIHRVAQKSLDTGGYMWSMACQMTFAPPCITAFKCRFKCSELLAPTDFSKKRTAIIFSVYCSSCTATLWRWRHYCQPKRPQLFTSRHSATFQ